MLLFLMNALWHGETISCICGAKRRARDLVMILTKEWMRLIGLKSPTVSAPSFIGRRIIFAELKSCRLMHRRS
ncbi:hypothetical protein BS78_02G155300 [Paspalum vaginatum]|nr:hypothetical protein BS78_02G155300 [Paspalum vaginatum]